MGLLSKANLLGTSKRLAFSNLIKKYSINFFALFEKQDENFVIVDSLGFDGASILASTSTFDFWKGVLPEEKKLYNFDPVNNPLFQFFSFYIKDNVKSICAFRFDNYILLICNNNEIDSDFINSYINIEKKHENINVSNLNKAIGRDSYIYKMEIDLQEAIENYLISKKIKDSYVSDRFSKSLYNEISNRFCYLYNLYDASVLTDNNLIKTVFITNSNSSKELLINHIVLNLKEVIDNSAEIINFNFLGIAETYNDITNFLQGEQIED